MHIEPAAEAVSQPAAHQQALPAQDNASPAPIQIVVSNDIRINSNAQAILKALAQMGAKRATVSYSGGGDEGAVDEHAVEMLDGRDWQPSVEVPYLDREEVFNDGEWTQVSTLQNMALDEALMQVAEDAMCHYHSGFWNGEGGEGEVIFCAESMKARIEHRDFYKETIASENEL
jgi:hypothetical protein